jgi:hypothetical protein
LIDNTGGTPKAVTLNGNNGFYGNLFGGLDVHSPGAIKVNSMDSNSNAGYGAFLHNDDLGSLGGVTITGGAWTADNGGYGMQVTSLGAITMNIMDAWIGNNGDFGWNLDNSGGTGGITITVSGTNNVDFWQNDGYGLQAKSRGAIKINNLDSRENAGQGAILNNNFGGAVGGVTIAGYGQFWNNNTYGLYVTSRGAITLTMVESRNNTGNGAYLDNTFGTGGVTLLTSGLAINDPANRFYGNTGYGIQILSNGAILANELRARSNGDFGASLDNGSGAAPVTLTGIWVGFTDNYYTGLEIVSHGAVTLNNLVARNNGHYDVGTDTYFGYGVYVDNTGGLPQNVSLNGAGTFENNWLSGLEVHTMGMVTLNNVSARWNGRWDEVNDDDVVGDGPDTVYGHDVLVVNCDWDPITNPDPTDWTCTGAPKTVNVNGSNNFEGNWISGLEIHSTGAVTVNNVAADNNGWGMYVKNDYAPLAPQNVTVNGTSQFNGNWANGLEVYSYGVITLNNVTANGNGWGNDPAYVIAGAVLDNCDETAGVCAAAPKSVILKGANYFEGNRYGGLSIVSSGAVLMNNVTTSDNGHYDELGDWGTPDQYYGYGALIINAYNALQGVTMTGANTFNGNAHDGLNVSSFGAITLNNLTANWNGWYFDPAWGGNDTDGPDTVYGTGAWLDNCHWNGSACDTPSAVNITLTGVNTFMGNWDDGLWFDTSGSFSGTKIGAYNNGQDGVEGYAVGGITLTCGNMHGNGWSGAGYGYSLDAPTIALNSVYGFGNWSGNFTSVLPVFTRTCILP